MLDSVTKNRINTARDILVGKVPDPKSQVEQITIALIYKFMDDMDVESEELGGKRTFFGGEYAKYSWRKIFDPRQSGYELLNLYSEAITKMDTNPGVPKLFRDIFKNAYLPYRDPETLKSFLKIINEFEYTHSEKLGDAFEFLLSILGSQGDAGQFRTPRHIIDFMVEIIDPKKNEVILDPACGTAGFLISSYKHIIKQNSSKYTPDEDPKVTSEGTQSVNEVILTTNGYSGDKLTADERTRLADNMHGYDISPDMVRLSLVNMYLHGVKEPQIFEYDSLTSEDHWNEYSDVILANPPFMSPKGGIRPHKRFSVQSNRSEVLFVDYIAEHLTQVGRAAVIVPEGVIYQSGKAYKQLRKMLIDNYLIGIISLPQGVFNPYSGVKTSILWFDKSLTNKTDKILFVKISNDGFDLGAQRKAIKENNLNEALERIIDYKNTINYSYQNNNVSYNSGGLVISLVDKMKICAIGDFNLSADRYIEQMPIKTEFTLRRLDNLFVLIRNGINVEQSDFEGKYRVSRIQTISSGEFNLNLTKWTNDEVSEDYYLQNGDILLSHINSFEHLAKTAIFKNINAKVIHGINLILLRPNLQLINPEYAIRILKSDFFINKARSYAQRAVNQASIRTSDIKSLEIPVPELSIQCEIVKEIEIYQENIVDAAAVIKNNVQKIKDRIAKVWGGPSVKNLPGGQI
jgi:type I restriction enzyme M protein